MAEDDPRQPVADRLLRVRWLARAPIWLYRARLGFLFGSRLLMLEHLGRRSRLRRYVVLEVAARPEPGAYVVAAGFGSTAQWFRNVLAHPDVRVSVGTRHQVPARARQLTSEQADAVLADYAAKHPRAWRMLEPVLRAEAGSEGGAGVVPVVELRLVGGTAAAG